MNHTTECFFCGGGTGQAYPFICSRPKIAALKQNIACSKTEPVTQHTPEPTRYGFCGKYLQEQPNGEYIKACHYDVIKQQRDELLAAAKAISLLTPDSPTTDWNCALLNLDKAIAKAGVK